MQQVLLVEDSVMFGRLAKSKIEKVFGVPVIWVQTYAETEKILETTKDGFSMALLDFNLPDAPNGEVIDRVVEDGISSLVFTSNMTDAVRTLVWSKKVADYILKDDPNSLDYIITAMKRLEENQNTLILVVDDSSMFRQAVSELLYIHKYRVITAASGESALGILEQHPEIDLVITDFNMPGMDGCQLCQKIRAKFKPDDVSIIGFSSEEDRTLGAKFIKNGANDFIVKQSFLVEEFYSRVRNCVDNIHLIAQIREGSIRDFLTGLHNRRHFFEAGGKMFDLCRERGENLCCIMIDIDFFKKVNDSHGHDMGDTVLQNFANLLTSSFNENEIVARIGGEEFCVLSENAQKDAIIEKVETFRQLVESTPVASLMSGRPLSVTASLGLCMSIGESLDTMMKTADEKLYEAKERGRNCVIF